jgi:hypothetical protein
MTHAFHIGDLQRCALEIYVFDSAHEPEEGESAFPGELDGNRLTISDPALAYAMLVDAANGASDGPPEADLELWGALSRLASRVLRMTTVRRRAAGE